MPGADEERRTCRAMPDEELELARSWAETTDEPWPIKAGFLTLIAEIDRLRPVEQRARSVATPEPPPAWPNDHSDSDRELALWILGENTHD